MLRQNLHSCYWGGVSSLGRAPTIALLYLLRTMDDDECGAVGGMVVRGNSSTRRKPAPGPLCPPQIPLNLTRGAVGEMVVRGILGTRRKPDPGPLCPPQIPHNQTRARTLAVAVGSQLLTA
jgi:hypothetical protein